MKKTVINQLPQNNDIAIVCVGGDLEEVSEAAPIRTRIRGFSGRGDEYSSGED